jgi:hypothetical protein
MEIFLNGKTPEGVRDKSGAVFRPDATILHVRLYGIESVFPCETSVKLSKPSLQ